MALSNTATTDNLTHVRGLGGSDADSSRSLRSAVSWGAIVAGAAAAASLSLILLILGVGLGLSSVSPWARDGVSATTLGVSTIVWLMLTQLLASTLGGYLAGRLRTRWTEVSVDEVYFRDTAHGFLAWAVASLATAALLTSVIASILNGGVSRSTADNPMQDAMASAGMTAGNADGSMAYFVDALLRPVAGANAPTQADPTSSRVATDVTEISRIFANARGLEFLPPEDIRYLGQIVALRTGISQEDAEKRVSDVYTKVQVQVRGAEVAEREASDKARKASAYSALWLFISLLVGAFVASLAATYGGRCRDT